VDASRYFFCAIGGSGMLPLALLVRAGGAAVDGSDRDFDQGRGQQKQAYLASKGIGLFPQDGSGVTGEDGQVLVMSAAVEEHVPDRVRARELGLQQLSRAALLSSLFNEATTPVAVAGTSGKSTITAMTGWILHATGHAPTILNGAVMTNFRSPEAPFASVVPGTGPHFVAEVDESDGSIAFYNPAVAVLANISLDHKSLEELNQLFGDYLARAGTVVVNADSADVMALVGQLEQTGRIAGKPVISWSVRGAAATLMARDAGGGDWRVALADGCEVPLVLQVFGAHNVSNALGAIAACEALGVDRQAAVEAMAGFTGVARRMEKVGEPSGVVVYDDFGHNPDKIAASLRALQDRHGRVLALFQPHGYGPMALMGDELVAMFQQVLRPDDRVWLTDPVNRGGTVRKNTVARDMPARIGANVRFIDDRSDFVGEAAAAARAGDAVIVMGARDDTLTDLARAVAGRIGQALAA
jgi:UDP-N-acetylmuramate--alanine ligase